MYPPFLTSTLTFWKGTQDHHSLGSSSPYLPPLTYTVLILASSTPEAREHIKLLDRLSDPSSKLIHRISHPSKEEISSEPNNSCFICIRVHSFALCNPLFARRLHASTLHPRTQFGTKTLSTSVQ